MEWAVFVKRGDEFVFMGTFVFIEQRSSYHARGEWNDPLGVDRYCPVHLLKLSGHAYEYNEKQVVGRGVRLTISPSPTEYEPGEFEIIVMKERR